MDTNAHEIIYKDLAYKVIGAAMDVHNALGCGFLEKVYENALMVALQQRGLNCEQQKPIKVYYQGIVVGDYCADILVENAVILELKVVDALSDIHRAQALNYLKATGFKLAILLNFAKPKLERERIVL
ncbi:MAG: GxxExxY protein [Abitibacteriaceae bacterium]|nr:GxxExxY protein [Abditibacteriaceae bacterium]MBV9864265.1 GxxExxY protein [Abditibacteriaceae bacterium]